MTPDPTYDQVLVHLLDILILMILGNALCIGTVIVLITRHYFKKKRAIKATQYAEKIAGESETIIDNDEFFKPFPQALLEQAQVPVYTHKEVFDSLTEMVALSRDLIDVGLFSVMVSDENFLIGLHLVNNVWNDTWEALPEEKRFFTRDAFMIFYSLEDRGKE